MTSRIQAYPGTENPTTILHHVSPVHPSPDSLHVTPVCAAFTLLGPKVSGWKQKNCALAPLRIKKKIVVLSPVCFVSPEQRETTWSSTTECYVVSWSKLLNSVLGTLVWGPLAYLLSRRSSHTHIVTWVCCLCEWAHPFNDSTLPIGLEVDFSHAWLKVSFSGSLWLFILGDCSPL